MNESVRIFSEVLKLNNGYSQEHNIHYLSYDHFALFAYFAVINNSDGKTLFSNILPPLRAQSSQRVSLICLVFNYIHRSN